MKKITNWLLLIVFALSTTVMYGQADSPNLTKEQKIALDEANRLNEPPGAPFKGHALNPDSYRNRDVIEIGDGTGFGVWPTYYLDFANYWENAHTQTLYLASEIGGPLMFTELQYSFERVAASPDNWLADVEIRILETTDNELTPGAFYDVSGATLVWSNANYIPATSTGWAGLIDIVDYVYDGTKNIIIDIRFGSNGYYNSTYFRHHRTDGDDIRVLGGYDDYDTPAPYEGAYTYYSNIRIYGEPPPPVGNIDGFVYDVNSDPVEGATVTVAGSGASVTTTADGSYLLANVLAGIQIISASKDGYLPDANNSVFVLEDETIPHDFVLEDMPPLYITLPENAHLGDWPIAAWQQGTVITATNEGGPSVVDAISIIGADADLFSFEAPDLPIILAVGDTFNITVSFDAPLGTNTGYYDALITLSYGARAATACDIDVTAYNYTYEDVFEDPYIMHWGPAPISSEPSSQELTIMEKPTGNSREYVGFYKNYILPNDLESTDNDMDYVYKLELEADMMWSIYVGGDLTNVAIYAEDFDGEDGPMAHNALYQFTESTFDMQLFAGDYYMVLSCSDGWPNWGYWMPTYMTAPAKVTYTDPDDHEIGITDADFLRWEYNDVFAEQYTVYLGTSQPFTDADIVEIAAPTNLVADTFFLADMVGGLLPNQVYFWQVDVMNNEGTTEGETWDFTSTISPPLDFEAASTKIFEGDVVNLTWTNPLTDARTLLGYNVYRDLTQLNIDPIADLCIILWYSGLEKSLAGLPF